jgi:rhomboid protease GluP
MSVTSSGLNFAAKTFVVHFSDPAVWARFGSRLQPHWKLAGQGEISVEQNQVVLRGRRPRPFWTAAKTEIPLPITDVVNVIREGSVVQCHVRVSGFTRVLRLWLADAWAADQLVHALPKERTADFERQVAEHASFNATLAALGTQSVIVPALVLLNCAIFAYTVYAGAGIFDVNGQILVQWGTNYGPRTLDGEWWRLLTATFLHFGLLHLAFNMWALWTLGQLTEKLYGSAYFLVVYLFAGLVGSLASLYWHPEVNSAGASGAIFGVLGGLFAFVVNPKTRIPASIAVAHRNSALVFIFYNLVNGFAHAGIDNAAHIGGLFGGFAIGWVLTRPVTIEARRDPLPRLALGSLLGAAMLIALSWPLLHPSATVAAERKFRHQFQLFAEEEDAALTAQRALDSLESSSKITDLEWGRRVATEVIPKWQVAEERISSTQLPANSGLVPLRQALLDYLDQQRVALKLLSDAARYDDPQKRELGKQASDRNRAKAAEIRTLIRRVY